MRHNMLRAGGEVAFAYVGQSFQQNTSASTSLVISPPTGIVNGDLLIAVMGFEDSSDETWTGDTGWTERIEQANRKPGLRIATKVASSESGDYTFTASNSDLLAGVIIHYRGATYDTIGAIDDTLESTDIVMPTITVESTGVLLAFCMKDLGGGTFTTPSGMSSLFTDTDANGPSIYVFTEDVSAGATGTRTSTPNDPGGTNRNAGVLLSIF